MAAMRGVLPVSVRPDASNVIVANTGLSVCSFRASTHALSSYKSENVSAMYPSTRPPVSSAISAYAPYASSKDSVPEGCIIAPVGPTSKNTGFPAARAFSIAASATVFTSYAPSYFMRLMPNELAVIMSAAAYER